MTAIKHARYDERAYEYHLIRDCLAGERAIKAQGQLYTPKPSGLSADDYKSYLARGSFYGTPEMTLRALVGLALRKDPVVKLPPRLEPLRLAATHDGAPMSILIEDAVRETLSLGRFGIMLDYPPSGATSTTPPHFVYWRAEEILDHQEAWIDGKKELMRVVLATAERFEDADVYMELMLDQGVYTVQRFIVQGENRVRTDVGEMVIPMVNGRNLDRIPMVIFSHLSLRPDDEKPPMLDLCQIALSHFRNSCEREHATFLTAAPTPVCIGDMPADKVPTSIGAGAMWHLPSGSDAKYLEFSGQGIGAQKELMDEKVDMMATLGARMLSVTMNRNETIDTATQRTRSELSLLHSAVVMVETAMNRMLREAAQWVGADPDEAMVTLNRDFIEASMDPKMIEQQTKLYLTGVISRQTLHENLQKGEIVRADVSWEDEKDRIEEDGGDVSSIIPFQQQQEG